MHNNCKGLKLINTSFAILPAHNTYCLLRVPNQPPPNFLTCCSINGVHGQLTFHELAHSIVNQNAQQIKNKNEKSNEQQCVEIKDYWQSEYRSHGWSIIANSQNQQFSSDPPGVITLRGWRVLLSCQWIILPVFYFHRISTPLQRRLKCWFDLFMTCSNFILKLH